MIRHCTFLIYCFFNRRSILSFTKSFFSIRTCWMISNFNKKMWSIRSFEQKKNNSSLRSSLLDTRMSFHRLLKAKNSSPLRLLAVLTVLKVSHIWETTASCSRVKKLKRSYIAEHSEKLMVRVCWRQHITLVHFSSDWSI